METKDKMLQYFFLIIITLLIPVSFLSASASTSEEDFPTLQILNGKDDPQEIPLKAIQSNGDIEVQDDYSVEPDNVIMVEQGKNFVLMNSEGTITKVEAIDAQLKETQLYFADNLVKADLPSAAYILSVILQTEDGTEYGFVTFLVVLAPTQTVSEVNIQNIINSFTNRNIDTRIIFEDDKDDGNNTPPEEEPSICYFEPNDAPECQPDEEGNCPNDWPMNEDGNCHPGGDCPDGYGRVDDDETGTCYPDDDTIECDNGAIVLDEDDCAIYDPPVAPEEEPQCGEGFVLENGACEPLTSNCGGIPCTASDKEDSTTTDPIPGQEEPQTDPPTGEEEPETTESEEVVEEIEEEESDNNEEDN